MRKVTIRFSDEDVDALDHWRESTRDPETGGPPSRAAALRLIVRRALRQAPAAEHEHAPATRADMQKVIETILGRVPGTAATRDDIQELMDTVLAQTRAEPPAGKARRPSGPALLRRR